MKFHVYRCKSDSDYFVVTDEEHKDTITGAKCCPGGGDLEEVGAFDELGKDRVAFDETLAKNSIEHQGFYVFEASSFAAVRQQPEMP